jgi:UDP:flavonoid glycosyltransferase YjiC (YdhE family)
MEHVFINSIPSQHEAEQKALNLLHEQYPGRPVVALSECFFMGSLPILAGAPGIRPTASLAIGITPVTLSSIDCAPFGPGLLPHSSPEGRERNKAMNKAVQEGALGVPQARLVEVFKEIGASTPPFFLDACYYLPDRVLQMCSPSVEYPRSDAPPTIRFAGGLPKGRRDAMANPPSWWNEIIQNKAKKIVAVSQGSVAMNFSDLVIPTMTGLKDRDDIITVVALGRKGAVLPAGTNVPANVRVADFIPFDELLPHCAVFITNGGYGAFQHAISNGTPLIVGGMTEDKPEVAARAEWCGVGINLKTATPEPEVVHKAVKEIISNPKYKKRSVELEAEMASFDPVGVVAATIDELAAGAQNGQWRMSR